MSANSAATPVVLDELVLVTTRLADLMVRENEILRSMRPSDIRDLQADKAELAQRYEHMMLAVQKDPSPLNTASPSLREALRSATTRFTKLLEENERTLRAVRSVSERIMKTVVSAATEQREGAAYSSAGVISGGSSATGRRAMPVTLNKQL